MPAFPIIRGFSGIHGVVRLDDELFDRDPRMFADEGIAGGQVQTFDQFPGPGSGFLFQAEQSRVGLLLSHSGQDDKLITAGSEAFAAGENLLNAAGGADDQLVSRLVANGIVDGLQPVDVNGNAARSSGIPAESA